jgi:hypothetical protein
MYENVMMKLIKMYKKLNQEKKIPNWKKPIKPISG